MAKTDPSYPLFPICAFLGFVFALIPLPWHMQSWNSGTCFFMAWTALACLNQFVNSVVWAGNVLNPAPWWCEISIRIYLGASVGIPASSFCIVRRLYLISTLKPIATTRPEKRRAVFVDSLFCVLFPVIYIAMQYIVQGHRYNIFEDIGCYPAIYNTLLSYFISMMWPVVIGVASAVYCLLSLYHFNQRRTACASLLSGSPGLSVTRYFRLMALAATELCCTTPLGTFFIAINAAGGQVQPWISWAWVHYGYSRVSLYPAIIWRADKKNEAAMELSRWLAPFCAIVFFAYFGFAVEARRVYLKVWHRVRRYCCRVLKLKMSGVDREKGFVLPFKSIQPPIAVPIVPRGSTTKASEEDGLSFKDADQFDTATLPAYSPRDSPRASGDSDSTARCSQGVRASRVARCSTASSRFSGITSPPSPPLSPTLSCITEPDVISLAESVKLDDTNVPAVHGAATSAHSTFATDPASFGVQNGEDIIYIAYPHYSVYLSSETGSAPASASPFCAPSSANPVLSSSTNTFSSPTNPFVSSSAITVPPSVAIPVHALSAPRFERAVPAARFDSADATPTRFALPLVGPHTSSSADRSAHPSEPHTRFMQRDVYPALRTTYPEAYPNVYTDNDSTTDGAVRRVRSSIV